MGPPGYYQSANVFMATHALGHMIDGYTLLVAMNQRRVLNKSSKVTMRSFDKFIITGKAYCHIFCLFDYIYITL